MLVEAHLAAGVKDAVQFGERAVLVGDRAEHEAGDGGIDVRAVDQVAEGDRVASRFVLTGTNRGRQVRLWGIVISRLRDAAARGQ